MLKPRPNRGPPTLLFTPKAIPSNLHELNLPRPGPTALQTFPTLSSNKKPRPTQSRFVLSLAYINLSPQGSSPRGSEYRNNLQHTVHPLHDLFRRFLLAPPTSSCRHLAYLPFPRKTGVRLPLRRRHGSNILSTRREQTHQLKLNHQHKPSPSPSASRKNLKKRLSARPDHGPLPAAAGGGSPRSLKSITLYSAHDQNKIGAPARPRLRWRAGRVLCVARSCAGLRFPKIFCQIPLYLYAPFKTASWAHAFL